MPIGIKGFQKGNAVNKGKKLSETHKRNIGLGIMGENNPSWKGGISKKHCIDCGIEINFYAKRCHPCYAKTRRGEGNHFWRGGLRKNKEYCAMKLRERRRKNPLSVKASYHKRRLLMSDLSIQTVQQVYEDNIKRYGTLTCYLCELPVEFGQDHLEHKTPLSRGGTNEKENLGIACEHCNLSKNNKTEEEYRTVLLTKNKEEVKNP